MIMKVINSLMGTDKKAHSMEHMITERQGMCINPPLSEIRTPIIFGTL